MGCGCGKKKKKKKFQPISKNKNRSIKNKKCPKCRSSLVTYRKVRAGSSSIRLKCVNRFCNYVA